MARCGAGEQFAALVAAVDVPHVTSRLGKGVLSEGRDDIRFAGTYVGKSSQSNVADLMAGADCVVALGVEDTDFNHLGIVTADYDPAAATDLPGPTQVQARDGAVLVGRGLACWGDVALGPLIESLHAAVSADHPTLVCDSGFSFVALTNVPVVERGYLAQFAWAAIGHGAGATARAASSS